MKTTQKYSLPRNCAVLSLGLIGLKSSHGFVILVGRTETISCLVFYLVIKMWENLYKKPYQTWKTVVKIFKKHQNVSMGTHKKETNIIS